MISIFSLLKFQCTVLGAGLLKLFSKHRPSGPMLSISSFVHMFSVCLCVCFSVCSLLRYHLNVFLSPLPKVACPQFLEIRNPWGKVAKRSGFTLVKSLRKKRFFCLANLGLFKNLSLRKGLKKTRP